MKLKKLLLPVLCVALPVGLCACVSAGSNTISPTQKSNDIFEKKLDEYATMLAKVALNVQQGQTILIECNVENHYFANKVIDKCYEAGAADVVMNWIDDYSKHEKIENASTETLSNLPSYANAIKNGYVGNGASSLKIESELPDENEGLDASKISAYSKARKATLKDSSAMTGDNSVVWVVAAVPNVKWAEKVFPKLKGDEAVSALWDKIFESVRVYGDGKVLDNWAQHNKELSERSAKMNSYNFKTLHYTNDKGTDFTVGLPKDHVWVASTENKTKAGQSFVANVPTEEIFTSPDKNSANGIIYASKPLVLSGKVIEGIWFKVENGRIVEAHADTNEDALQAELDTEDAARYFGEVALVPFDSPISNQNILYYNTLFDENASCHIAFGACYSKCYKNGIFMSKDELSAAGLNFSSIHDDFMVGTKDLKIVGTTWDGQEITVFENGNFAF